MATYEVKVRVDYFYEVEAENEEEAEKLGWEYEDYGFPEVYSITVHELPQEEDEEEDEDEA